MSNIIEIHDTNIYENISLVLLENINTNFNLNIIKNNSLLFLKDVCNSLIKQINIRGFQYCIVTNKDALLNIPINFIISGFDIDNHLDINLDIQTYILKDKNTLKCYKCSNEINKLEKCTGPLCHELGPGGLVGLVGIGLGLGLDINLIYTLTEPTYNKTDKFQDSMLRDAVRVDFATKRENYKKHMKHVSSIKSNTSNGSGSGSLIEHVSKNIRVCKAITKKGIKCMNKCIKNSDYCGISSHK